MRYKKITRNSRNKSGIFIPETLSIFHFSKINYIKIKIFLYCFTQALSLFVHYKGKHSNVGAGLKEVGGPVTEEVTLGRKHPNNITNNGSEMGAGVPRFVSRLALREHTIRFLSL